MDKSGHIRSISVTSKAYALMAQMERTIQAISYYDLQVCDVDFVVRRILEGNRALNFRLDFLEYAATVISQITVPATRKTYEVALSRFRDYLSRTLFITKIDINDLTISLLRGFASDVDQSPKHYFRKAKKKTENAKKSKKKGTAARAYLGRLAAIYRKAETEFNDESTGKILIHPSPFRRIKVEASHPEGQRALSLQTMRALVRAEAKDEFERAALDTFIVSFGLMGANLVDLYKATPPASEWAYRRTKTERRRKDHAQMRVSVPDCLRPYIERLTLNAEKGRWLNLSRRYSSVNSATKTLNEQIKGWAVRNGLAPFTFYSARKSWATIARSKACGVDKAVVDECLAHVGDFPLTDIYAQRDWEVIWEANKKVCDLVF